MTSPPDALRWQLRQATAAAHARVDAVVGGAFEDAVRYAGYLRGMHRFLVEARGVLAGRQDLAGPIARLEADLRDLGTRPLPARARPAADAAVATGWHYVIAGASLGARLLVRRAAALGFDARHGARYLHAHAGGGDWPAFLATLDARPLPVAAHPAATAAAQEAFAAAEAAFHAAREPLTA